MLAFIIPLRSSKSTGDWDYVCALFERTLQSICSQDCDDFCVKVVCNEIPDIGFSHPQVEYVQVDFEVAQLESENKYELRLKRELDKVRRMYMGFRSLDLDPNPSYVMFVDADDCVSNKIAGFVASQPVSNGWYINSGYEYPEGKNYVHVKTKELHLKTNSSHIVRYEILKPFTDLEFSEVGLDFLSHQTMCSHLDNMGYPLQALPFPGVTYVVDHGENIYMQRRNSLHYAFSYLQKARIILGSLKRLLLRQSLTEDIRNEFSLFQMN